MSTIEQRAEWARYAREWRKRPENKGKRSGASKRWRQKNPIGKHLASARQRAKRVGLEFTLTLSDIVIPEFCPILQKKIEINEPGKGQEHKFAPSLDRVDNTKGYTPGNVRIISAKANRMKGDMSIEDVTRLLAYMKGEL